MNKSLQALIAETKSTIAKLYARRNIPHHVEFISLLAHADGLLGLFELHGFDRYTAYHRFSMVILRFRRKCYLVKFSDEFAPHHCRICSVPTGTSFRVCSACMAAGHIRQQESAQNEPLSHVLPKPRPRRPLETEHQETASQRFLRRFGAEDGLAAPQTSPRAMKNPLFTASAFPPAYVPSPEVAGGGFSSGSIRQLLPVDFRVAVPVTPPLCLIRETFPQKSLSTRTAKGGSNAS